MLKSTRNALFTAAIAGGAFALGACAKQTVPTQAAACPSSVKAAESDQTPVAKFGDKTVTNAELTAFIRPKLLKAEMDFNQQTYQVKAQAIEEYVHKQLIDAAAKKENITPEQLTKREVDDKIKDPTDAETLAKYEQLKAQRGGQAPPFDAVKPQVANIIKREQNESVRKAFIDKLLEGKKIEKLLPPLRFAVSAEGKSQGDDKAPVTIVEFSDYQCPFCGRAEPTVKKVMDEYKGKVKLVFRDYPLSFHDKAQKASEAAHCAADQNKYWEMHEKLFANQKDLDLPKLKEYAKAVGVDQAKFDKCLDSGEKAPVIKNSMKAGEDVGVTGTPAFFINGRMLSGAQPFEEFKKVIDEELAMR